MTLPVGIHAGVPMSDYLLHHGLSASRIHTLLAYSPFHAYHAAGGEPSEASEIGTAIHDALLEGVDRIVPCDFPDWRRKDAQEIRKVERANGRIPLLAHKVPQILQAVDAATAFVAKSEIAGVFERGKAEQTIIWSEGALVCKARPDFLTDDRDWLIHVKTTQGSAEPNSWIRNQLTASGYDVAMAFYERGLHAMGMERHYESQHVFLIIEQNQPYGCSIVGLDPAMADLASRKVERAIRTWQQCKATGIYPAYPNRICYAEPRPWDMAAEEERDLGAAYDQLQAKEGLQA